MPIDLYNDMVVLLASKRLHEIHAWPYLLDFASKMQAWHNGHEQLQGRLTAGAYCLKCRVLDNLTALQRENVKADFARALKTLSRLDVAEPEQRLAAAVLLQALLPNEESHQVCAIELFFGLFTAHRNQLERLEFVKSLLTLDPKSMTEEQFQNWVLIPCLAAYFRRYIHHEFWSIVELFYSAIQFKNSDKPVFRIIQFWEWASQHSYPKEHEPLLTATRLQRILSHSNDASLWRIASIFHAFGQEQSHKGNRRFLSFLKNLLDAGILKTELLVMMSAQDSSGASYGSLLAGRGRVKSVLELLDFFKKEFLKSDEYLNEELDKLFSDIFLKKLGAMQEREVLIFIFRWISEILQKPNLTNSLYHRFMRRMQEYVSICEKHREWDDVYYLEMNKTMVSFSYTHVHHYFESRSRYSFDRDLALRIGDFVNKLIAWNHVHLELRQGLSKRYQMLCETISELTAPIKMALQASYFQYLQQRIGSFNLDSAQSVIAHIFLATCYHINIQKNTAVLDALDQYFNQFPFYKTLFQKTVPEAFSQIPPRMQQHVNSFIEQASTDVLNLSIEYLSKVKSRANAPNLLLVMLASFESEDWEDEVNKKALLNYLKNYSNMLRCRSHLQFSYKALPAELASEVNAISILPNAQESVVKYLVAHKASVLKHTRKEIVWPEEFREIIERRKALCNEQVDLTTHYEAAQLNLANALIITQGKYPKYAHFFQGLLAVCPEFIWYPALNVLLTCELSKFFNLITEILSDTANPQSICPLLQGLLRLESEKKISIDTLAYIFIEKNGQARAFNHLLARTSDCGVNRALLSVIAILVTKSSTDNRVMSLYESAFHPHLYLHSSMSLGARLVDSLAVSLDERGLLQLLGILQHMIRYANYDATLGLALSNIIDTLEASFKKNPHVSSNMITAVQDFCSGIAIIRVHYYFELRALEGLDSDFDQRFDTMLAFLQKKPFNLNRFQKRWHSTRFFDFFKPLVALKDKVLDNAIDKYLEFLLHRSTGFNLDICYYRQVHENEILDEEDDNDPDNVDSSQDHFLNSLDDSVRISTSSRYSHSSTEAELINDLGELLIHLRKIRGRKQSFIKNEEKPEGLETVFSTSSSVTVEDLTIGHLQLREFPTILVQVSRATRVLQEKQRFIIYRLLHEVLKHHPQRDQDDQITFVLDQAAKLLQKAIPIIVQETLLELKVSETSLLGAQNLNWLAKHSEEGRQALAARTVKKGPANYSWFAKTQFDLPTSLQQKQLTTQHYYDVYMQPKDNRADFLKARDDLLKWLYQNCEDARQKASVPQLDLFMPILDNIIRYCSHHEREFVEISDDVMQNIHLTKTILTCVEPLMTFAGERIAQFERDLSVSILGLSSMH